MANMQRAGGVGTYKLDLNLLLLAAISPAIACSDGFNFKQTTVPCRWGDEKVYKAWACNLYLCEQLVLVINVGKDDLCYLAWSLFLGLGQLHGDVAGKVAVVIIGCVADGYGRKIFGRKRTGCTGLLKGLRNQCG